MNKRIINCLFSTSNCMKIKCDYPFSFSTDKILSFNSIKWYSKMFLSFLRSLSFSCIMTRIKYGEMHFFKLIMIEEKCAFN